MRHAGAPLRALASIGSLALTGCFPLVSHPTRVEEGLSLGVSLGVQAMADSSHAGRDHGLLPSYTMVGAVGFRDPYEDRPALRLAGGIGFSGYLGNAYLEFPRAFLASLDAGIGFTAQKGYFDMQIPYLQVGGALGGDRNWFLTQGFAFVHRPHSRRSGRAWLPTVGIGERRDFAELQFFLTAIVGRPPEARYSVCLFWCDPAAQIRTKTLLLLGVSAHRVPPPRRTSRPRRR
jgi:hypothetical protein